MSCSCLWSPVNGRLSCDECATARAPTEQSVYTAPLGTPVPPVAHSAAVEDEFAQLRRLAVGHPDHPAYTVCGELQALLAALDASRAETARLKPFEDAWLSSKERMARVSYGAAEADAAQAREREAAATRRAEVAEAHCRAVVGAWRRAGADCGSLDHHIEAMAEALGVSE